MVNSTLGLFPEKDPPLFSLIIIRPLFLIYKRCGNQGFHPEYLVVERCLSLSLRWGLSDSVSDVKPFHGPTSVHVISDSSRRYVMISRDLFQILSIVVSYFIA